MDVPLQRGTTCISLLCHLCHPASINAHVRPHHHANKAVWGDGTSGTWGFTRRPWFHSQWATLWHWMDWKPLKYRRHCVYLSHAGSRSYTA